MGKELDKAEEVKEIAEQVIEEEGIFKNSVLPSIDYIFVTPHISKTVIARCIRAGNELKYYSKADYIVEVSEDIWHILSEDIKKIVILHELLHIYPVYDEDSGNYSFKLIDHDIKDFRRIVDKYGTDWFKTIKKEMADKLELKAEEIDNITL